MHTNDNIYRETLLEYYKNPENKRVIADADIIKHDNNPTCGDSVEFYIKLDNNKNKKIVDVSFDGSGCVISMASAEMLTHELIGKHIDEIKNFDREKILKMLGLQLTPTRIKCAMLPLTAVKKGIIEFESKKL